MEVEWNKLTQQDRADFSAWRQQKQAEAEAAALAAAAQAARPKLYKAMTEAEKRTWLKRQGIAKQPWAKV